MAAKRACGKVNEGWSGKARLGCRRRVKALQAGSLAGIHGKWARRHAGAEDGTSADRQNWRKRGSRVERSLHGIGYPAGPTRKRRPGELRALPLILLVGVGIEIFGEIFVGVIACLGRGLNESSDVGDDGEIFLSVEEALHLQHVWMQAISGLAADLQRQELRLGNGEQGASLRVAGVARVDGNNHVVAVVAAEHEDADESLVVRGALSQSADEAELAEAAQERSAGGGAAGQPQHVSARVSCRHRLLLFR